MLAEIFMTEVPKRIRNFIGFEFGDECVVIGYLGQGGCGNDQSSQWLCECKCGSEFKLSRFKITNGKYGQKSCPPCVYKNRVVNTVPMIGKRFNRWLVLKEVGRTKNRSIKYLCKCDCGTIKEVDGCLLRRDVSKSCGCINKERDLRGKNNPNWNPNLTDEERQIRRDARKGLISDYELKNWRKQVFERDDYTCRCCGAKKSPFNAHHLNGWNKFVDQRYDLSNGLTLCIACHKLFHKKYGSGDNTKSQYQDFVVNLYNG